MNSLVFKYCLYWCLATFQVVALAAEMESGQAEYERSVEAIVRQKHFYKKGHIELGGFAGLMPYDSLISHYLFGGRLTWHLSDHYGWEVLDAQVVLPAITNYSRALARDKGLSNLQTLQLKSIVGSNFLLSPFYGKIRFFGRQVLYLDLYVVGGLGLARAETVKLSSTGVEQTATESITRQAWDPLLTFGFGFKIFLNDAMGLIFDFRDYLVITKLYGASTMKSNFSTFGGLVFFLPIF